jgi:hypothetical protein
MCQLACERRVVEDRLGATLEDVGCQGVALIPRVDHHRGLAVERWQREQLGQARWRCIALLANPRGTAQRQLDRLIQHAEVEIPVHRPDLFDTGLGKSPDLACERPG